MQLFLSRNAHLIQGCSFLSCSRLSLFPYGVGRTSRELLLIVHSGVILQQHTQFSPTWGLPMTVVYLMKAVPDEHKKFLANLVWIHEEDNVTIKTEEGIKRCKLIAVHAGLEKNRSVEQQIKTLKAKDTRIPKVAALSGRKDVWEIPQELAKTPTIIVSGHHAKLHIEGLRLVIDQGGGFEDQPVAAIVLPSLEIVRDTDHLVK